MNKNVADIHIQGFVWTYVFSCLMDIGLEVELLGPMVTMFNF